MTATITEERQQAQRDKQQGMWAVFRGRNLLRFIIAAWPKITQQFVGLSVFNTYATYFCMTIRARSPIDSAITNTEYFCSSVCWKRGSIPRNAHFILRTDHFDDHHLHAYR